MFSHLSEESHLPFFSARSGSAMYPQHCFQGPRAPSKLGTSHGMITMSPPQLLGMSPNHPSFFTVSVVYCPTRVNFRPEIIVEAARGPYTWTHECGIWCRASQWDHGISWLSENDVGNVGSLSESKY